MATPNDIYNEISRIDNAKQGIAEAIEEKGVQVPENSKIDEYPGLVRQIQQGSPDAVLYTPQDLTPEQQEQARENIGAYTKPETGIPADDLAEPVQQELAKAETAYQKPGTGIPKTDLANGVQTSLEKADTALQPAALTPITDLIPEQATPQNQLADKNFVNSSVATNTANYISDNGQPFQSVADLEAYTGTLTNNDYAFVVGTDSAGNTTYTRYKYNATTQTWAAEYVLNNSSFTAEQWAAISSGITALLVQKLSELPTEIVTYVAQTLTEAQKQQARTNIGATAPEIFTVTYNVTPISDIQNAVLSGLVPICIYNGVVYVYTNESSTEILFTASIQTLAKYLRITKATNVWYTGQISVENVANKTADITGNRTSTGKYPNVKGVFDAIGKWGVVSQTQTWTGQPATGYDYTMSNLVWGLIPQANIDLYVSAGAVFNENTGYFELNGLTDISYNEMSNIYSKTIGLQPPVSLNGTLSCPAGAFYARTCVPLFRALSQNMNSFAYNNYHLESLSFPNGVACTATNYNQAFLNCQKLKRIIGRLTINNVANMPTTIFQYCYSLESINIYYLGGNIYFSNSPRLNLESIVYLVDNAVNTTAITITLHATAYARCVADTTEYTYNGQTYTGIIAYAAARNITIASA